MIKEYIFILKNLLEIAVVNHPVHFKTKEGKMSPSALIPFCALGGNMSAMGVKIPNFSVPVCDSFQATILNDQLCYEVDLNIFSDNDNINKELKNGFVFLLDYNEDRQKAKYFMRPVVGNFFERMVTTDSRNHAIIYLNTIGLF